MARTYFQKGRRGRKVARPPAPPAVRFTIEFSRLTAERLIRQSGGFRGNHTYAREIRSILFGVRSKLSALLKSHPIAEWIPVESTYAGFRLLNEFAIVHPCELDVRYECGGVWERSCSLSPWLYDLQRSGLGDDPDDAIAAHEEGRQPDPVLAADAERLRTADQLIKGMRAIDDECALK